MFYGLDLDPDFLWIKKKIGSGSGFSKMPGSGLRLSESRLKLLTMRNYRDETSTEFCTSTGLRFLARGFLVANISLGYWASVNLNIYM